jgi:hypothetical protein
MSPEQPTPRTAILPPSAGNPLSLEHYEELAAAKRQLNKIRAAARVATFNGWTIGVLAALSVPFAAFSVEGALMTIGLSVIAYIEFRGRRGLLQYDPSAATLLGWNQVGLLTLISVYCLWALWTALRGPGPLAAELQAQPELGEALGSAEELDSLYRGVAIAFYGVVILLSLVFQGLNAVYYFTRRKYILACLRDTPQWVLDLERASSGR